MQISYKVALSIAAVIAVAGTVATTVALSVQEHERREEFAAKSVQTLELLARSVAPAVNDRLHHQVQAVLDNVANYQEPFPDLEELEVVDHEGLVIAALDPTRFREPGRDPELARRALESGSAQLAPQPGSLSIAVPVRTTHVQGAVRARFSQARLVASIDAQKRNAALFVVATMLLVGLALFLLERKLVTNRVRGLASTAGALGAGKLAVRAASEGDDEIAALGQSFNSMAEAIQHYTDDLEHIISERTDELEQANRRLERLAITDQLTALANRRHFDDHARRAIEVARRNERPLSVVLVDTDRFKSINDRFGHPVGDAVLQAVARVLSDNARKADLVARIGGEEFAVLMPEAAVGLAAQGAERMRAALESEVSGQVPELEGAPVTASFGVAAFERADDRLEDLLAAADAALYRAKENGRNRVEVAERAHAGRGDHNEVERELPG